MQSPPSILTGLYIGTRVVHNRKRLCRVWLDGAEGRVWELSSPVAVPNPSHALYCERDERGPLVAHGSGLRA